MYIIDSAYEQPDITYLQNRIEESINQGIAVKKDIRVLYKKLLDYQESIVKNMRTLYGIANPNSPKQIVEYFQAIADEEIIKACVIDDAKWTTNKDAMMPLAKLGYPEAIDLLLYRKAKKYAESVKSIIDATEEDRRIRPTVTMGKTNRINYKEPALMNIPKQLLWHVIAPRNDNSSLFSVDIKQQEPWILCNMLNIEELREVLRAGEDLYRALFKKIFDEECSDIQRNEIKVSWNAMSYGATIMGIKKICKHCDAGMVYKYFGTLKEFKDYKSNCYRMYRENVQEVQTHFGTTLYADEYGPKLQRVLMDIPIQGTGADILALLVKHFDDEAESRGLEHDMDLYYTRHDEMVIEVSDEIIDNNGEDCVVEVLRDIFEHQIDDWDPFKVKIGRVEAEELVLGPENYDEED